MAGEMLLNSAGHGFTFASSQGTVDQTSNNLPPVTEIPGGS